MVNWQNDRTLSYPTDGTGDTWSADIEFLANPVGLYRAFTSSTNVGSDEFVLGLNTQLGDTFADAYDALIASYQRWRIAYYSATVYYDAPALSDQGSVVAAQFPLEGRMVGGIGWSDEPNLMGYTTYLIGRFTTEDFPSFEKLLTMPNAYSGLAKDGVYLPLRLDSNHSQWKSEKDSFVDGSGTLDVEGSVCSNATAATRTAGLLYPSVDGLWMNTSVHAASGQPIPGMCSGIAGQASFRNLAKVGRLRVVVRAGYECMASPGTAMTPFLAVSPPYDPQAIAAYYQISRELKDAYPASYNDLGKLWEVIKQVARVVAPVVPAPLRMVGSMVGNLVDTVRSRRKDESSLVATKTAPRDGPPAAAMERVQRENASRMGVVKAKIGRTAAKRTTVRMRR